MGASLSALTLAHVAISLIGIVSGLVVTFGLLRSQRMDGLTALFLVTTVVTSVTGFLFPFQKLLPSHILGVISLVLLAFAIAGRYAFHLAGAWRRIYSVTAVLSLWLNVFVLIAQLFMKVPALHPLAPTGSEPPFLIAQTVVMIIFIALAILAAKNFRSEAVSAPRAA
jgi:hypothetical protein